MNREQLFRDLYASMVKRDEYLSTVPSDLQLGVCDNQYVNSLWDDYSMLAAAAFGEYKESIDWFLYEWRPGFECGIHNVMTKINSIDDYIEWMKANEGF